MTDGVLLRVCRAQASLAETLVEPWLREHDSASRAQLIESLLPRMIGLCAVFQELHTTVWRDLFAGGVHEIQDVGSDLQQTWTDALAFLAGMRDKGRECLAQGYLIDRFDDLERAMEAVERTAQEHNDRCPWIDKQTVTKSTADIESGLCRGSREVLDALRA